MIDIQLIHGDSLQALKGYGDNHFKVAIVDPPYGINAGKMTMGSGKHKFSKDKDWDSAIPSAEYFAELFRVSENQIVWGGNYFGYLWQGGCKGFICWNKLNHHDNRADVEMAWTSFNKLAKYVEYMWDGNRYATKGNIKGVGKPTIRIHPTEKPVYLYEWLLMNYAESGNKIIDTHLGSGSIAEACFNLKYDLVGIELDKDYYTKASKRLEAHKKQLTLF